MSGNDNPGPIIVKDTDNLTPTHNVTQNTSPSSDTKNVTPTKDTNSVGPTPTTVNTGSGHTK